MQSSRVVRTGQTRHQFAFFASLSGRTLVFSERDVPKNGWEDSGGRHQNGRACPFRGVLEGMMECPEGDLAAFEMRHGGETRGERKSVPARLAFLFCAHTTLLHTSGTSACRNAAGPADTAVEFPFAATLCSLGKTGKGKRCAPKGSTSLRIPALY